MSSSIDYRVYVQGEIEEANRLTRVFQGDENDRGVAAEHYTVDHLPKLLTTGISKNLASMYTREYTNMRASMRALAVSSLTRKDFYDAASQEELNRARKLSQSLAVNDELSKILTKHLLEHESNLLTEIEESTTQAKNATLDRIREASGATQELTVSAEDVLRAALSERDDVNGRGVSRGPVMER